MEKIINLTAWKSQHHRLSSDDLERLIDAYPVDTELIDAKLIRAGIIKGELTERMKAKLILDGSICKV